MSLSLPAIRVRPGGDGTPSRRSFLRYTGASAVVGSLWLAGCKKDDTQPATPTLASFTPASGVPGTTITLVGTNFLGATGVTLGGVAAQFAVVSATSITLTVPVGAASGAIVVTTPAGSVTSGTAFTVTAAPSTAPTITGFAPASALPGAIVTVTGTNFTGASNLTVNGLSVTPNVSSATSLTFQVPTAATAGVATVVVMTPGGTGTDNGGAAAYTAPVYGAGNNTGTATYGGGQQLGTTAGILFPADDSVTQSRAFRGYAA